jgi:hypothetical protein
VRGLGLAHGLILVYDKDGRLAGFLGAADPRGPGLALGY